MLKTAMDSSLANVPKKKKQFSDESHIKRMQMHIILKHGELHRRIHITFTIHARTLQHNIA